MVNQFSLYDARDSRDAQRPIELFDTQIKLRVYGILQLACNRHVNFLTKHIYIDIRN